MVEEQSGRSIGWQRSVHTAGQTIQIPANYGTEGGLSWWDWRPTFVPPTVPMLPRQPLWNRLRPVDWKQQIISAEEQSALIQAGLLQTPSQRPALYVPPGTASLEG